MDKNELLPIMKRLYSQKFSDGFELVATYCHHCTNGASFVRFRLEHPKHDKFMQVIHKGALDWDYGEPDRAEDKDVLIYPYPHNSLPSDRAELVIIVEGEKKAEALRKIGLNAVSISSATDTDRYCLVGLHGRPILLWRDNDESGFGWYESLTIALYPYVAKLEAIEVAKLSSAKGYDAVDWLKDHPGAGKEDILALSKITLDISSVSSGGLRWHEPRAIDPSLLPVEECPIGVLPDILQAYVLDQSTRLQTPVDFAFIGLLIACGGVLGSSVWIKPKKKDNWLVPANIWGGIVADPSQKKSPSMKASLSALQEQQAKTSVIYEEALRNYSIKKELFDFDKDRIKSKKKGDNRDKSVSEQIKSLEVPTEPQCKRYITNDATYEKLGDILKHNHSLQLVLDEMSGWLCQVCDEKNRHIKAFYLSSWGGDQPYTFDRINRGTFTIPNLSLSIFGAIQPERLLKAFRISALGGNDGFIQRFQFLVWPDSNVENHYVDEAPNTAAQNEVTKIFEIFSQGNFEQHGAKRDSKTGRIYFEFSTDGQRAYEEIYNEICLLQSKESSPLLAEYFGKLSSCHARICLILHLLKKVVSPKTECEQISKATVHGANAVIEYLISHARRIYDFLNPHNNYPARALASKIKEGKLKSPFTNRDVQRKEWAGLTGKDDVETAVNSLIEDGWLRHELTDKQGPGRPSKRYLINPKVVAR